MHEQILILGVAITMLGYGYFSKLLSSFNISGAIVFTSIGFLLSYFGLEIKPDATLVQILAEIALIVILFSDAAIINISTIKWRIPNRLLFVAMPLSIAFAFLVGRYLFNQTPSILILMLALILAPTDAALGKAVVSDKRIPEIVRSSINVESGLNDGIVFPLFLTVLAISLGESSNGNLWGYIFKQIIVGAIAGGLIGFLGAKLFSISSKRDWIEHSYKNLTPLALAIFAFYFAEHFGGNGYISAFFAGLIAGNISNSLRDSIENFAESEGELFVMVSFLIFGLIFIPNSIVYWNFKAFIYAILSLTIIRIIPVIFSFGFFKIDLATRLFIGWFGPRGIASILYILVAVSQIGANLKFYEEIFAIASLTITLSIFLHGFSAKPFVWLYTKKEHKVEV